MKRYIALFAAALLCVPAALQAAAKPGGLWEGSLSTPNGDIGFVFNIHQDGDKWAAEMDIPMQGLSEFPLKDVKVDGASVSFALPGPGEPHFDGKVADDGKAIAGNFLQGGATLPLNLKWKADARPAPKAAANSGEVQVLEGVWEGALDANGTTLHVRFKFVKGADGNITGTLDSLDQGANGLPVGAITRTGDKVTIDLKAINGSYAGTLNKDATGMTGTFTQNGFDMDLALTRKGSDKK